MEETVDHFARVLPLQALHYACDSEKDCATFAMLQHIHGLHDRSIIDHLHEKGVRELVIIRRAIREILQRKGIEESDRNIFDVVESELRGARNPLLPHVRAIINTLTSSRH